MDNSTMVIANADDARSLMLLKRAYKEIYEPFFAPDEREPLEDWIDKLSRNNSFADIAIAIAGENLDTRHPVLMGLTVGYYYKEQDAGLLGYCLVGAEYQDQSLKLQHKMMETVTEKIQLLSIDNGGRVMGIFIAADDPEKMPSEDESIEAKERLDVFKGLGAQVVNIDYIEPPVCEGGSKNAQLKLLAYPGAEGNYPDRKHLQNYLTGLYEGLSEYTGCSAEENPDYVAMMDQVDSTAMLCIRNAEPPVSIKPKQEEKTPEAPAVAAAPPAEKTVPVKKRDFADDLKKGGLV